MRGSISPGFVVCALGLLLSPVAGQQKPDAETLPQDVDELVALLDGEHLPFAAMKRGVSRSRAARAAAALLKRKDDAVPALAKGLESNNTTIRINAVYLLSCINIPATLPLRIKAASDPDAEVRAQAVGELPAYDGDDAHKALLKGLKDPDAAVRNAAIQAFHPNAPKAPDNGLRMATARVLLPLLDDPATQYRAATVLGALGSNVASVPLLKLLKAQDVNIRYAAVCALGELKDNHIVLELTAALHDQDSYVRTYAAQALGKIGDLRASPALVEGLSDTEPNVRSLAATALGRIGDLRAVPSLVSLLEDSEDYVRAAAAEALGQIGDVRAVEPLCALLARQGRDAAEAARALGKLHDQRAIEPLARRLLAPDLRSQGSLEAVDALAKIRHPDSVVALFDVVLNTRDSNVRNHARYVLGELTGKSFSHEANETIAAWWKPNREHYVRPISPGK